MKKALITGVYGQDGSFLAELLANEDFEIYGICRKDLSTDSQRIKNEVSQQGLHINESSVSLYEFESVKNYISEIQPDFVYHMAAMHRGSGNKFNDNMVAEKELYEKNVQATSNILLACYEVIPKAHIVTAGSCLMFDACEESIQSEKTRFQSLSMYGNAKIAECNLVNYYRRKGLHASTAILYNHESHRRGSGFVTKKIVEGLKKIKEGKMDYLELGNLTNLKDWGYAKDYAKAMVLMSQTNDPKEYIIASGKLHSIQDFVEVSANLLEMSDWKKYIKINEGIITRNITSYLQGNAKKIHDELGWKQTLKFEELVMEMIHS